MAADSNDLASRLLFRQCSVSTRVELNDPVDSQAHHNRQDEVEDLHGPAVTFSAVSFSSPSHSHTGTTGKRPRPPRLSSHCLTPELLSHIRPSKIRLSSKLSDKTRFPASSMVSPLEGAASAKLEEDQLNLEWQLLPSLKEVIPGDLRKSVLQASTDRLSTIIQSDAPRSVQSFPKVSRTSSRHGPVPLRAQIASSRFSGDQGNDGETSSHEACHPHTESGIMMWKRRRGKFALSSPSDRTNYMWMSFLNLLREEPDYPEFIYLQPAKASSSAFDPYDLDIVAHNEISSPYFYTMSSAGITLFRDLDAEFISLDEWENDFEYYKCIMKLNVFRQYKIWKSFAIWRRFVRRKLQGFSRKSLIKQLFSVNPILQQVLLQICQMSLNISELHLFQYDKGTIYQLEEFLESQQMRRESILKKLLEFFQRLKKMFLDSKTKTHSSQHGALKTTPPLNPKVWGRSLQVLQRNGSRRKRKQQRRRKTWKGSLLPLLLPREMRGEGF